MLQSRRIAIMLLSATAMSPAYAAEKSAAELGEQPSAQPRETERTTSPASPRDDAATDEESGAIVVTGSRIRRPNLDSAVPITSVSHDELTNAADVNLGEALNDLPSLRSTVTQGSGVFSRFSSGLNFLDLRGLGPERTLVLVNNRRHVTSSVGRNQVDINTIPVDLIERVDIVTGGNSAIYGSDAVAGVVNFVLRRNFDGIQLHGQQGITSRGDHATHIASAIAGQNFADDRGNIAVALEFSRSDPLYFRDRDAQTGAFSGRCQFNQVEPTNGEPPEGDGIPDQAFLCGLRVPVISTGGIVFPAGRVFGFDQAGNLVENPFDPKLFPFGGFVVGGFGTTTRETGQFVPGLTRYSANLLGHFDVTPAFKPFVEATYSRVDVHTEGQPSFNSGGGGLSIRCNNPFVSQQNLNQLQSLGFCGNVATGAFTVWRFNTDVGARKMFDRRETYRVVGGVEGTFNGDWRYELSLNYGEFKNHFEARNDLVLARFSRAVDAVRAPNGSIVCRVNADADPTNDDPTCMPLNLLGSGRSSQAAYDSVNRTSTREDRASQFVASAFVNGDLSGLFELPGGPVAFAVGAEYRRETGRQVWDPIVRSGQTFFGSIADFAPPALSTKEAFGELRIPVLKDLPFAKELTIEAAGRVSDYSSGGTGTVFAYNVGGIYAPTRDLRLRATYSTSVRAPTQADLFAPTALAFATLSDPCDVQNIGARPNRARNCAAAGIPVGFVNQVGRQQSSSYLTGGNPNLQAEKGKNYSIGAVLTPRFIPGLSVMVDYYNITVKNLIASLGPQTIIDSCYDSSTGINNGFCRNVFRNADFTFASPVVIGGNVNFQRQETEGIDFEVDYRRALGNGHRIEFRGVATYLMKLNNFVSPADPNFADRIKDELGDPTWAANASITYDTGKFNVTYSLRYIGRQINAGLAYETFFSVQGRPPENADAVANPWGPARLYHSIRLGFKASDRFRFYMGVENIGDTMPPYGLLGSNFGGRGEPYDVFGRAFYAGAQVNF